MVAGRTPLGHRPGTVTDEKSENGVAQIRLGAKALCYDHGRVLLIRERREDGSTFWTLPGGGIKPNESLPEGLCRELMEELRCQITIDEAIGRCAYEHTTRELVTLYIIFACELVGAPIPNPAEKIVAQRWINPRDPPATTLAPVRRLILEHTNSVNRQRSIRSCASFETDARN